MRDEVNRTELMLKRIAEDMGALEAEAALQSARLVIVDAPQEPKSRRIDRKVKMAGVASVGLFGMVALGVALVEFGKRRVYGSGDVAQGLGINLLATLPTVSPQARRAPAALADLRAPLQPDQGGD